MRLTLASPLNDVNTTTSAFVARGPGPEIFIRYLFGLVDTLGWEVGCRTCPHGE